MIIFNVYTLTVEILKISLKMLHALLRHLGKTTFDIIILVLISEIFIRIHV